MATHENQTRINQSFGCATVTIDLELCDCVVTLITQGIGHLSVRTVRLHSMDQIEGAYYAQRDCAAKGAANRYVANADVARDCASALKFALQTLNAQDCQGMKCR